MATRNLNLVSEDKKTAVLERARALVPVLAQRSAQTERERRVPDETIADFFRNGLFRILQPARFGGAELRCRHVRGGDAGIGPRLRVERLGLFRGRGAVLGARHVSGTGPDRNCGEDPAALACAALMPSGNGRSRRRRLAPERHVGSSSAAPTTPHGCF